MLKNIFNFKMAEYIEKDYRYKRVNSIYNLIFIDYYNETIKTKYMEITFR